MAANCKREGEPEREVSPVAANLIAELKRTGMSGAALARALGISERQITRWRGKHAPRYESVVAMAEVFGRPTEWFYTDHRTPSREVAA